MTFKSIIKRILAGPIKRKVKCFCIKKGEMNEKVISEDNLNIVEINQTTCVDVRDIRDESVVNSFEKMLQDSSIIILAKKGTKCVGHAVLKPAGISSTTGKIWMNKYYIHYCYVAPEERGKNIYPYMLQYLVRKVFSMDGSQIVYISASLSNQASIRGIVKAGFKNWGLLSEYGWGGIIFYRRFKMYK